MTDFIVFARDSFYYEVTDFIVRNQSIGQEHINHSTVTLLARLRGLSTSVPRAQAVW